MKRNEELLVMWRKNELEKRLNLVVWKFRKRRNFRQSRVSPCSGYRGDLHDSWIQVVPKERRNFCSVKRK